MFRPFTGSSWDLYKNQKVYYIFKFCMPNAIPCGLQSCTQLVKGAMKRWKIKCGNTQHIPCPVCPMFLVEFGVWIWRMYELWLIIDGIVMAPAACRLSCCLYVDMHSLVCWTRDASWSVVVAYSAWMKSAPACSPWTDETVGPNTSSMLTLSLMECLFVVILSAVWYAISRAVSLWGVIRKYIYTW
jgi:hypothetical protein